MGAEDVDSLIFEKPDDVGKFLVERPPEWAQAIAVRLALRFFPLVLRGASVPEETLAADQRRNLVLQTFRALFIARAACFLQKPELGSFAIYEAAASAVDRISPSQSENAPMELVAGVSAAKVAAYAAHLEIASASSADIADAAILAAQAAVTSLSQGDETALVLNSISADCQRLLGDMPPGDLIRQPLWFEELAETEFAANQPVWLVRAFETFANSDWSGTVACRLISQWYEALVPVEGDEASSAFGEKADLAIAVSARRILDGGR